MEGIGTWKIQKIKEEGKFALSKIKDGEIWILDVDTTNKSDFNSDEIESKISSFK
mgnify:CR=1 FL=1